MSGFDYYSNQSKPYVNTVVNGTSGKPDILPTESIYLPDLWFSDWQKLLGV